jgi:hypothetical protein
VREHNGIFPNMQANLIPRVLRNKNQSGPGFPLTLLPPRQFFTCPPGFQKRNDWGSHSDSSAHSPCLLLGKIKDRSVTTSNGSNTWRCSFHVCAVLGNCRVCVLSKPVLEKKEREGGWCKVILNVEPISLPALSHLPWPCWTYSETNLRITHCLSIRSHAHPQVQTSHLKMRSLSPYEIK